MAENQLVSWPKTRVEAFWVVKLPFCSTGISNVGGKKTLRSHQLHQLVSWCWPGVPVTLPGASQLLSGSIISHSQLTGFFLGLENQPVKFWPKYVLTSFWPWKSREKKNTRAVNIFFCCALKAGPPQSPPPPGPNTKERCTNLEHQRLKSFFSAMSSKMSTSWLNLSLILKQQEESKEEQSRWSLLASLCKQNKLEWYMLASWSGTCKLQVQEF